jgi:hypothetical protein
VGAQRRFEGDTLREATLGSRPSHADATTLRIPEESLSRLMFGGDNEETVESAPIDLAEDASAYLEIERKEREALALSLRPPPPPMDPLSSAIRDSLRSVLGGFAIPSKKIDEASRNAAQGVLSVIEEDRQQRHADILAAALVSAHLSGARLAEAALWDPQMRPIFMTAAVRLADHLLGQVAPSDLLDKGRAEIVEAIGAPSVSTAAAAVAIAWQQHNRILVGTAETIDAAAPVEEIELDEEAQA